MDNSGHYYSDNLPDNRAYYSDVANDDYYYDANENRTDILKLILYDLNSAIAPRDVRLLAIHSALEEFDHDDELLHDEELELRADHILLQKLTYALSVDPQGVEVGYICSALEMVYRAGRTKLAQSFHEICDVLLPVFVEMIRPPLLVEGTEQRKNDEPSEKKNEDQISNSILEERGSVLRDQPQSFMEPVDNANQTNLEDDDEESAESVTIPIPSGTGEYFEQMNRMSAKGSAESAANSVTKSVGDESQSNMSNTLVAKPINLDVAKKAPGDVAKKLPEDVTANTPNGVSQTMPQQQSRYTKNDSDDVRNEEGAGYLTGANASDFPPPINKESDNENNKPAVGATRPGIHSRQSSVASDLADYDEMVRRRGSMSSQQAEPHLHGGELVLSQQSSLIRQSVYSGVQNLGGEGNASSLTSNINTLAHGGDEAARIRGGGGRAHDHEEEQTTTSEYYEANGEDQQFDPTLYESVMSRSTGYEGSQFESSMYGESEVYNENEDNPFSDASEFETGHYQGGGAHTTMGEFGVGQERGDGYGSHASSRNQDVDNFTGKIADFDESTYSGYDGGSQASHIHVMHNGQEADMSFRHEGEVNGGATSASYSGYDDQNSEYSSQKMNKGYGYSTNASPRYRGYDDATETSTYYQKDGEIESNVSDQRENEEHVPPGHDGNNFRYSGTQNGYTGDNATVGEDSSFYSKEYRNNQAGSHNDARQQNFDHQEENSERTGNWSEQRSKDSFNATNFDAMSGRSEEKEDHYPTSEGGHNYINHANTNDQFTTRAEDMAHLESTNYNTSSAPEFGDSYRGDGLSTMAGLGESLRSGDTGYYTDQRERMNHVNNTHEVINEEESQYQENNDTFYESYQNEDIFQFEEPQRSKPLSSSDYFNSHTDDIAEEGLISPLAIRKVLKILRYFSRVLSAMEPMAQQPGLVDALLYQMTKNPYSTDDEDEISARVDAIAVIVNLACAEENKIMLVYHPGLLDAVIKIANHDPIEEAREHAAIVIMNLAYAEENKVHMVNQDYLLDTLVHLLSDVSPFTRRYASAALFTLACTYANTAVMARHCDGGILEALRKVLLNDPIDEARVNAAEALFNMARNNSDDTVENMGNHPKLLASLAHSVLTDYSADVRAYSARALEWLSADIHHPMKCHPRLLQSLTTASQWTKTTCIAEALKMQASLSENRRPMVEHEGLLDALATLALLDGINDDEVKTCAISALERLSKEEATRHIMVKNEGVMTALTKATFAKDGTEDEDSNEGGTPTALLMKTALKNLAEHL